MDSARLNDWIQITGMLAVVASLIFVGFELRQAHEIALSQAYQSRTSAAAEFNMAFAANEAALSALRKADHGRTDAIAPEEYDALRRTLFAVYYLYDNAHYQYQQGFVSEEFWSTTRENMKAMMSNPVAHAIFLERIEIAGRPDFNQIVLGVSQELKAQRLEPASPP